MALWIATSAGVALAYLLGSLPTGYLAGRLLKGVDIRGHGSGSTGATNVLRTVGPRAALATIVVDLLKGVGAILLMRWLYSWMAHSASVSAPATAELPAMAAWGVCLAGLAVVVGHGRSVWLGFTGGKSAATGLGVLLAMSLPVGLGAAAAFGLALAATRIVSLSSIVGAASAVAVVCALPEPLAYRLMVAAGGIYVVVRHRANITRLLSGAEPKIGRGRSIRT
jgi:glycerol-3-phosphate acyltransferase PlsY